MDDENSISGGNLTDRADQSKNLSGSGRVSNFAKTASNPSKSSASDDDDTAVERNGDNSEIEGDQDHCVLGMDEAEGAAGNLNLHSNFSCFHGRSVKEVEEIKLLLAQLQKSTTPQVIATEAEGMVATGITTAANWLYFVGTGWLVVVMA
jgi:hypothetical protein